jgi:hypothetical protein
VRSWFASAILAVSTSDRMAVTTWGTKMDRSSKIIFALIAAGLWSNAASSVLQPAHAQRDVLSEIMVSVQSMAHSLETLVAGDRGRGCTNRRLCESE